MFAEYVYCPVSRPSCLSVFCLDTFSPPLVYPVYLTFLFPPEAPICPPGLSYLSLCLLQRFHQAWWGDHFLYHPEFPPCRHAHYQRPLHRGQVWGTDRNRGASHQVPELDRVTPRTAQTGSCGTNYRDLVATWTIVDFIKGSIVLFFYLAVHRLFFQNISFLLSFLLVKAFS